MPLKHHMLVDISAVPGGKLCNHLTAVLSVAAQLTGNAAMLQQQSHSVLSIASQAMQQWYSSLKEMSTAWQAMQQWYTS